MQTPKHVYVGEKCQPNAVNEILAEQSGRRVAIAFHKLIPIFYHKVAIYR